MGFNLKNEDEVKEYLENLGTEYRFGCYHEKKPEVCHLLGDFFEAIKQEWDKAGKLYEVNCDEYKYGHSCFKFGNYNFTGKGSLKADHAKAMSYYDKGCHYKYPEACLHAGLMRTALTSQIPKDDRKAFDYFNAGCNLKSGMCCFYVSGMYISGVDGLVPKDMKKAFEYSKTACDLGNVYACANLSQMYAKGEGVTQSATKAEEYKQLALDMQNQVTKQFRTIAFEEGA